MIVFCDTDAVIKLSSLELLSDLLELLDVKQHDVHLLKRELKVLQSQNIIDDYGKPASQAAVDFASKCSKLTSPDPEEFKQLLKVMDPGEATMLSCTKDFELTWIITGDGRALKALACASNCVTIINRINGKVLCFDQVLLALLNQQGIDSIRKKILKAKIPDFALRSIFRDASKATKKSVELALQSRIDDLREHTGDLLWQYNL